MSAVVIADTVRIPKSIADLESFRRAIQSNSNFLSLLQSPSVKIIPLTAPPSSKARGRIFWDEDEKQWHIFTSNLQPPSSGRVYRLAITTTEQKTIPLGVIEVDATGKGAAVVTLPDAAKLTAATITDEPESPAAGESTGVVQLSAKFNP